MQVHKHPQIPSTPRSHPECLEFKILVLMIPSLPKRSRKSDSQSNSFQLTGHERAWAPTRCLCPVCARAAQRPAASCRLSTPGAGIGTTLRLSLGGWRIRFLRAPVSRKICGLLMLLVLGVREGRRGSPDWPVNFPGAPLFSSLIGFRSAVGWGIKDQLQSALSVCGLLTTWLAPVDSQIRVTQAPAVNGLTFIPMAHAIVLYSCNHLQVISNT